jgi:threonine dehydratase
MPDNSPTSKRAAVRAFGGEIVFCAPTMQAREHTASQVMASTGAVFIHPYDDFRVMAGQGTATLELLEQVPDLDIILCPVGGGGLLSGTAVVAKALNPSIRVIGVEPAAADDAYRSFRAGKLIQCPSPQTVADGLRASLGVRPFAEIKTHVSDIVTVTEGGIIQTMRLIWEAMKLVVEPSGAVAYAAIVEGKIDVARQKVGIILSGGNLDLDRLPWQS